MSLRDEILYDKLLSDLAIKEAELKVIKNYTVSEKLWIQVLQASISEIEKQIKVLREKKY